MKKKGLRAVGVGVLALGLSGTAQAILVSGQGTWETTLKGRDLDGDNTTAEAYYDTELGITWLGDANYAQTSGYDADGRMTWADANAWAASLNLNGITGWRLPDTVDVGNDGHTYTNFYHGVDYAWNITTHSEMSHMFYETLGNLAQFDTLGSPQPGYGLTNTGPFSNLQSNNYWSATEYAPNPIIAWVFDFGDGSQGDPYKKTISTHAWAVHSGDVGASIVPIPAAAWLFGSALLGLVGVGARRRR